MADAATATSNAKVEGQGGPRRSRRGLLLLLGIPLLLAGGIGGALVLKPDLLAQGRAMLSGGTTAPADPEVARPVFVEIPEMTITLPNGGRSRQLRIHISLELAKVEPDQKPVDVLTPRVYDSLVTYLRTLRDSELDGAVAVDRLRGDLFRRLDLLLGRGVLRDVLITGLVIA
ncbi:Flagellar biosynthesis protein fliL (plasmid) [Rhodovastum atsumiense]|uniref:flagellar basal body-associated FliL family protein n=1 Tax=Rhodovastum atsumiense TaxID=504468 RepID=UPI0020249B03|nr:flagellar basal body-associated FliL family protein [Rhodovastum atsumiense]CAH2605533.1 Flagellar biosynthesis protein fliL [Rhodovastum atsumiense]